MAVAGSSPTQKRAMIQSLSADAPIQRLCDVFDGPRRTDYYQSVRRDESALLLAIEQVLMRHPWFGCRRVVAQLQREGLQVGETIVRRLLKGLGHSRSVGQVRVQTTDSNHSYTRYSNLIRGLLLKAAHQVWVADITYVDNQVASLRRRAIQGYPTLSHSGPAPKLFFCLPLPFNLKRLFTGSCASMRFAQIHLHTGRQRQCKRHLCAASWRAGQRNRPAMCLDHPSGNEQTLAAAWRLNDLAVARQRFAPVETSKHVR